MADLKDKIMDAAKNIDKDDIKKVLNKALESDVADKAIDAAEKKINKDIDKKDIKSAINNILK